MTGIPACREMDDLREMNLRDARAAALQPVKKGSNIFFGRDN
jgi:hypothetical protein